MQRCSTLKRVGLPSPATVLFNRPIMGLLPHMNGDPININNDDMHYEVLETYKRKYNNAKDTSKVPSVFIAGVTAAVQQDNGSPGCMV